MALEGTIFTLKRRVENEYRGIRLMAETANKFDVLVRGREIEGKRKIYDFLSEQSFSPAQEQKLISHKYLISEIYYRIHEKDPGTTKKSIIRCVNELMRQ